MKKMLVFGFISLIAMIVVLSGCSNIAGRAGAVVKPVIANSCDADSICEVAKTVSTRAGSTSSLVLTSDNKFVVVDGTIDIGNLRIGGKSVSTIPGSTSSLVLTADNKFVVVDGTLSATSLYGTGNAYACLDGEGKLFRSTKPCT